MLPFLFMSDESFKFYAPLSFFEKADAPEGLRRRVAGLITTERKDREGETILQRGLDFSEFLDFGWFNDNHAKEMAGVVGYPEGVRYVRKGERLPDGREAPADGHWAEGWMLDGDPRADTIWQKALALQKSGNQRKLGFSIEGVIERRSGEDRKIIAKARVRNVAITHCPVNTDTQLVALAKSLERAVSDDEYEKMCGKAEDEEDDLDKAYKHIDFSPPAGSRRDAQRGLDLRREFGRGGTGVGIARARDLARGANMSPDTMRRMKAFFDRHQQNRGSGTEDPPTNGYIAWLLWGGDPGRAWAEKVVRQMNAADEANKALMAGPATSNARVMGPVSGVGAGRVLSPQSLEGQHRRHFGKSEAVQWVMNRHPNVSLATAERMVELSFALRDRELL